MDQWYVAHSKPRQEQLLARVLAERGIPTYLPRRWHASKASRGDVLFPGYLFCQLDFRRPGGLKARSAPGLAYYLGDATAPTPVPDDLIEHLRRREEHQRACRNLPFKPGDRVQLVTGPFAGLEAVFAGGLNGAGRTRILIELMGRLVSSEVPISSIVRCTRAADHGP